MGSTLPYVNGNVIPILCAHCYRRAMTRRLAFALAATLLAVPPAPATETSPEKAIPGVADPYKTDVFDPDADPMADIDARSEEHTSELQSLMRISYAVFCLKKKKQNQEHK